MAHDSIAMLIRRRPVQAHFPQIWRIEKNVKQVAKPMERIPFERINKPQRKNIRVDYAHCLGAVVQTQLKLRSALGPRNTQDDLQHSHTDTEPTAGTVRI